MHGGVLVVDANRRMILVALHPGGNRDQTAAQQFVVDLELFVTGGQSTFVRYHPHLNEMHGVGMLFAADTPRIVLLTVHDSGTGAHALGESRIDDAGVADGILVHERTAKHPGHDFHVLVRMGVETGSRQYGVVVVDEQQSVMSVVRIVVLSERERMFRIQPGDAGFQAIAGAVHIDVRCRPWGLCSTRCHGSSFCTTGIRHNRDPPLPASTLRRTCCVVRTLGVLGGVVSSSTRASPTRVSPHRRFPRLVDRQYP